MSCDFCPGCMFVCQPNPWSTTINKTTSCQQPSLGNGAWVLTVAGCEQGWCGLSENTSQRSTMASRAFIGTGWPTGGQFQHRGWSCYQINRVISWFQHQPLKPGSSPTSICPFPSSNMFIFGTSKTARFDVFMTPFVLIYICFYSDSALRIMGFKWWHPAPYASDRFHHALVASLIELIKGGETVTRWLKQASGGKLQRLGQMHLA